MVSKFHYLHQIKQFHQNFQILPLFYFHQFCSLLTPRIFNLNFHSFIFSLLSQNFQIYFFLLLIQNLPISNCIMVTIKIYIRQILFYFHYSI